MLKNGLQSEISKIQHVYENTKQAWKLTKTITEHSRALHLHTLHMYSQLNISKHNIYIAKNCLNCNKSLSILFFKNSWIHVLHANNISGHCNRLSPGQDESDEEREGVEFITISVVIANMASFPFICCSSTFGWTWWNSRVELFLLEVGIKTTLSIVLQQNMKI